jgi:D-alanine-D-alanine ligase
MAAVSIAHRGGALRAQHPEKKKLRITVLTYAESEKDRVAEKHDIVIDQVVRALKANGHRVSVLHVHGDVTQMISGLKRRKPDLVFNLMEMFGDDLRGDIGVVGLLELLKLRYTGGSAGEFYLAGDKALAKKLLAYHELKFPKFALFSMSDAFETGGRLRMPLFVKPARMDASIGIDKAGLVHDANALMKQVLSIHKQCKDDALAEEYIDGRELYVAVIGNEEPVAFPPIEMSFAGLPPGAPHVMDARAKFDETSVEFKGTEAALASLPRELEARLQEVAIEAYRALRVRDYGRVDLRLTPAGDIYVLEVNASCYLEEEGEFATAARAGGYEYPALVQKIVDLAMARQPKR